MLELLLAMLVAVAPLASTVWLCRRVLRRWAVPPKAMTRFVWVVLIASLVGALGTSLGVIKAFSAVGGESVDPSQKARVLAEGMSEAINWSAFSLLVWLPSTAVLVFLLFRKPEPRAASRSTSERS